MIMGGSAEPRLDHPTQKPLLLFETPIRNHLKPGEPLYEPFSGSGTALIAAERTGTRCYAMEIDPITSRLRSAASNASAASRRSWSMADRAATLKGRFGVKPTHDRQMVTSASVIPLAHEQS
jgi:hypothetical protein